MFNDLDKRRCSGRVAALVSSRRDLDTSKRAGHPVDRHHDVCQHYAMTG